VGLSPDVCAPARRRYVVVDNLRKLLRSRSVQALDRAGQVP
jgi:hypothetical protein